MTLLNILDTETCTQPLLANTTDSFRSIQKQKVQQQQDLPRILAILAFASLGTSLTPYALALINIRKTFLYTIPSILACLASIPFHVGAVYGFWAATRQHSYRIFRFCRAQKLTIVAYLMLLQVIWLFAAVMSGFGMGMIGNEQGALCWSEYLHVSASKDACTRNLAVIFTLSMFLSLFEVVLLGAISVLFVKWDPSDKGQLDAATSHLPVASNEGKYHNGHSTYFLVPLLFASLGLALPPFIVALLDIFEVLPFQTIPYTIIHCESTPTLLAFVFTAYTHIISLRSSHCCHGPASLHKPCNSTAYPDHGTAINTFLPNTKTPHFITLAILWLLSALFNAKRLFESEHQSWPTHAYDYCRITTGPSGSSDTICIGPVYPPLSFLVSTLSASMEVVILIALLFIARRYIHP